MLADGWEVAPSLPGACADPAGLDALRWAPAPVPGTVAAALGEAAAGRDLDAEDWWFRCAFDAEPAAEDEEVVLRLGGLATIAEVYVNGTLVLESESMFAQHTVDVSRLVRGANELAICFRALRPRLAEPRKPRARWRTRLVTDGNLRFYRTMLLGRAPGLGAGPAVVGPWRPVSLERRRGWVLDSVRLRPAYDGQGTGRLTCGLAARALSGAVLPARLELAIAGAPSRVVTVDPVTGRGEAAATLPGVAPWWPHTHGEPTLHEVVLSGGQDVAHRGRVGFRRLQTPGDLEADGLGLQINGVPVFARGAVWTPGDLRAPGGDPEALRATLRRVAEGGMNMLRVPGIGAYEDDLFYDLCDELGILVWQDFMFANLDYPDSDSAFMAAAESEAREILDRLAGRPSLAVLCGGSEVAQQVAMMGLDPTLADGPLYHDLLPRLVREAGADAPYVPSTPWGGDLPFRTDHGVANYYGVGAYRRPLEDARRAEVKFAAECLAFANLPDEPAEAMIGVPRDAGSDWDFADVRDHYLQVLYGVDGAALRDTDPDRYLELSRAVSGEVMAEVLGEWRRAGSPCQGALVLWLRDLDPGAGWGVLDHRGRSKVAFRHLARALAPVAVWSTDEGLGGIDVHLANDGPSPLRARLRVALYQEFQHLIDEAVLDVELEAHGGLTRNVEELLGRFVDVSWAYRFGPPAQDLIAVTLETPGGELLSQAFRFPAGRPLTRESASDLGLDAVIEPSAAGPRLHVTSRRFAYGVRATVPGYTAADDAFGVAPGGERRVALRAVGAAAPVGAAATLHALNLSGAVAVRVDADRGGSLKVG
jgi:beta-mannosidase